MSKGKLLSTLAILLIAGSQICAQEFSNKGKDFWVGYGYHERMSVPGGGTQDMVLYFATDVVHRNSFDSWNRI